MKKYADRKTQQHQWYLENKELTKKRSRERYLKHRDALLTTFKEKYNGRYTKSKAKYYQMTEKDSRYKRQYGITREDRDIMFAGQGFRCAVCGTDNPGTKNEWATDHCHKTNIVRGVLCNSCNIGLGHLKDNPNIMMKAVNYLNPAKYSDCANDN